MRITESRLRKIIREVIKEAAESDLEFYDSLGGGYIPNIEKIKQAYFHYLHGESGTESREEWAERNLHMSTYRDDTERREVEDVLKQAERGASEIGSYASGR